MTLKETPENIHAILLVEEIVSSKKDRFNQVKLETEEYGDLVLLDLSDEQIETLHAHNIKNRSDLTKTKPKEIHHIFKNASDKEKIKIMNMCGTVYRSPGHGWTLLESDALYQNAVTYIKENDINVDDLRALHLDQLDETDFKAPFYRHLINVAYDSVKGFVDPYSQHEYSGDIGLNKYDWQELNEHFRRTTEKPIKYQYSDEFEAYISQRPELTPPG
ncbi:MAG: hypothetical protein AAF244_04780 [Pseudomonadota bacterium]